MELLVGCGHSRKKRITFEGIPKAWSGALITLDCDDGVGPDVVHDLTKVPYPFDDDMFDEVHAYEVMEHCGQQGDWRLFFNQFYEFWRILKPGGYFCATVPMWDSVWAWADPGHTRVIAVETLIFLNQAEYPQNIEKETSMTDYRFCWEGDFELVSANATGVGEDQFAFVLRARKPIWTP